ncbi:MAG: GAF domain-containing sensor histidine kinase [Verrucomicrobiales bacterium]|nr:GAF domain-containing sensor histidine kinase [Verrucomicrobiales bacterium]
MPSFSMTGPIEISFLILQADSDVEPDPVKGLLWVVSGLMLLIAIAQLRQFIQRRSELEKKVKKRTRQVEKANRELATLRKFSAVVSEISTQFINLEPSRIEEEIPKALERTAKILGAQRSNIFLADREKDPDSKDFLVRLAYQWKGKDVPSIPEELHEVRPSKFRWVMGLYFGGSPIVVEDFDKNLPAKAVRELSLARQIGWGSVAIIPMMVEGRVIGDVNFCTLGDARMSLPRTIVDDLRTVGQVFANALDRRRRAEDMQELREDALRAEERERTRISRELHDQLGGALSGLRIHSRDLQRRLAESNSDLIEYAERMTGIIDQTLPDVRRICTELRPAMLDELDIVQALEWQAHQLKAHNGIQCEFSARMSEEFRPDSERDVAIYRIVQELLTNVLRHAGASRVEMSLSHDPSSGLTLMVADDGCGFDLEEARRKRDHFGLRGIGERVEYLQGEVEFQSSGSGVTVVVNIPEEGEDG